MTLEKAHERGVALSISQMGIKAWQHHRTQDMLVPSRPEDSGDSPCAPTAAPLRRHGKSLPPTLEEFSSLFTVLGITLWDTNQTGLCESGLVPESLSGASGVIIIKKDSFFFSHFPEMGSALKILFLSFGNIIIIFVYIID